MQPEKILGDARPHDIILKIDLRNAFNSIHRDNRSA